MTSEGEVFLVGAGWRAGSGSPPATTPAGEHVAFPYSLLRGVPCHQLRVALLPLDDAKRSDSPLGSSDATAAGRWTVMPAYRAQVDGQAPLHGLQGHHGVGPHAPLSGGESSGFPLAFVGGLLSTGGVTVSPVTSACSTAAIA